MGYRIIYHKQAQKDLINIKNANLKDKVIIIINILSDNPYTPPYEKLVGDLQGLYSRRINLQHRLIYQIFEEENIIKVIRMWTHYE